MSEETRAKGERGNVYIGAVVFLFIFLSSQTSGLTKYRTHLISYRYLQLMLYKIYDTIMSCKPIYFLGI